ncbi:MAG: 3-phosphoserine/phosphohydroxythreonine transaminase [Bacteroides sp.]|nr:3-phosphoserine/phosphohydroxythreonine transaminase [Bacteroides sp.]MCM1388969.1 3-phosphoserine/phosphohydroxythreonine transaminase [Bacteroides sp.]
MKKHNFYAGPAILPETAVQNTAKAILDFNGTSLSIMEISHRSQEFKVVIEEAMSLFKELLNVPDNYSVFFMGGGASTQFALIPYNLLEHKAAYLDTGVWANKAIAEAEVFGDVEVVASSREDSYNHIPKDYSIPADADYFHITTNNTIYGTQLHSDIDSPVPLVADMSSDIFSRVIDVTKYDMIYGGAQKNLSQAGVTFVLVKNDLLGKVTRRIPKIFDYRSHIKGGSMYNTPPVVPIFTALETMRWIKAEGGVSEMERRSEKKARLLYNEIDRNKVFRGTVIPEDRSYMNVCFVMADGYEDKEQEFLSYVSSKGIVGIKGHRLAGGFRASLYNALPIESVQALVDAMQEFENIIVK